MLVQKIYLLKIVFFSNFITLHRGHFNRGSVIVNLHLGGGAHRRVGRTQGSSATMLNYKNIFSILVQLLPVDVPKAVDHCKGYGNDGINDAKVFVL